ncbi:MAG: N-acetylmuramic acid 6-phosphate etherase [Nitrospiraceae bacterium]|nr:N-acetylmuramic acid 6-phosphate etherase [Nitrospiraceae bacterium]
MGPILAFDGGTTRTRAGLYTSGRRLLAQADGAAANPTEHGIEACVASLTQLARQLNAENVACVAAGLSGAGREPVRDELARRLHAALAAERILVTSDLMPILQANAPRRPAVIAMAGTGSCVAGHDGGGRGAQVGGRGSLFGDDGSAYQVAVSALRGAADALDGLGAQTALVTELPAAAGLSDFSDFVTWSVRVSKEQVAALARTVQVLAERGDGLARGCLTNQAVLLAGQTLAAAHRLALQDGGTVYILGGMFEHSAFYRGAYEAALATATPRLTAIVPEIRGHRAVLELAFLDAPVPGWLTDYCGAQAAPARIAATERVSPRAPLDALTALEMVRRMAEEDAGVPWAVRQQAEAIASIAEASARALEEGGRLVYVGAGTSGRLGVLDASECPPTFGVPAGTVVGIIAGGERALRHSVERAEDDIQAAVRDLAALTPPIGRSDVVVGLTASGATPYVLAALAEARTSGATTAIVTCNPPPPGAAHTAIVLSTGPEVVAGSTRLKAGTATKLVLNTISTAAFALRGLVYEGHMVGVVPSNAKLRRRAARTIAALTGVDSERAQALLDQSGGRIPVAVLMARQGLTPEDAERKLLERGGSLRGVLEGG